MAYRLVWSARAQRAFRKLDRQYQRQLKPVVAALAEQPRPEGAKSLKGGHRGLLRVASGNYRVIYTVDDSAGVVTIERVGDRKDVYE